MEELVHCVEVVRRSALRGARSVTNRKQVVEDAVLRTLEQWEDAVLKGKKIDNVQHWAFRVAANATKRSNDTKQVVTSDLRELRVDDGSQSSEPYAPRSDPGDLRAVLRAQLGRRKNLLRGRQLEVMLKLAEPGMTQNRAAREVGMNRSNLRRTFRSALARLKSRSN